MKVIARGVLWTASGDLARSNPGSPHWIAASLTSPDYSGGRSHLAMTDE